SLELSPSLQPPRLCLVAGNVALSGRSRWCSMLAAATTHAPRPDDPPPGVWPRRLPLFCHHILQRIDVQHLLRHNPLQPCVLRFQLPQPVQLFPAHLPEAALPAIDRVLRYAIRARYLSDGFATPYFIQNADALFFTVAFAMLLLAHENVPPVALFYRNTLTPPGSILWGEDRWAYSRIRRSTCCE